MQQPLKQPLQQPSHPFPAHVGCVDHVLDGVYIGGARAYDYISALRAAGINRVLKLYFDVPDLPEQWPGDFVVCYNPLHDGEPIDQECLRRGVAFVKEQVDAGRPALVMCAAGISRSSTFVLAYLVERGHDLHDAWQLLSEHHPQAGPLWQMWLSLLAYYMLPYSLEEVINWVYEAHRIR